MLYDVPGGGKSNMAACKPELPIYQILFSGISYIQFSVGPIYLCNEYHTQYYWMPEADIEPFGLSCRKIGCMGLQRGKKTKYAE